MRTSRALLLILLFVGGSWAGVANAQDPGLQPKYGLVSKTPTQKAADEKFLAQMDTTYKGDRKKAAGEIAESGWDLLHQGKAPEAMQRFNQAWLLDSTNARAIWGMGAVQANMGKGPDSLKLFAEAEPALRGDVGFLADYAKALGIAGAQTGNQATLQDAFARFQQIYQKDPQLTSNLQNWAITLFYVGDYAQAWQKVKLAEATPGRAELDPNFLAALQGKMARP